MLRVAVLILILAVAAPASGVLPTREVPLYNVELVDSKGVQTSLSGYHFLNGDFRFQGYLGSAEIEIGYDRVAEVRIAPPAEPGGRMRADLHLRTGNVVRATFDEREGELMTSGFASFGRVTYFFRDLRLLRFVGKTKRSDLPVYGTAAPGVDARVRDRHGVETELVGLHRPAGENVIKGIRGSGSVAVPLRILRRLTLEHDKDSPMLTVAAELAGGSSVRFHLPTYAEQTVYRGEAEFGAFRICIGEVRELTVHRVTPVLRDLDPAAAADGREAVGDRRAR
jgi:hypothetical protein